MHRLILAALLLVCAPAMAQTPAVDSITLRAGGHIIGMPSADVVGALGFAPVNPSALGNISGLNLGANLTSGAGSLSLTGGNVTGALGYAPINPANNLSDIASAATTRANLGLGAVAPIGTTVGTVAAGNDSRIVGAAQAASLGNASTRNTGTTAGTVAAGDDSRIIGAIPAISTGADIATSGAAASLSNDIIPMLHSQRLRTEQSPNICFAGTSTGQYQGTGLIPQATTQGIIWQAVLAANPTKSLFRVDRAIGGSNLGQLAGLAAVPSASRFPGWVGSTGLEWPANIQTLNCSQLYIMEAENNAGTMDDTSLRSFLTTVSTWTNPPDLFIVPNRMPGPGFGTGNPTDYIRPWSYMRSLSKAGLAAIGFPSLSLGLVDVGRWQAINQFGLDYAAQTITTVINQSSPITPTLTGGVPNCASCTQYVSPSTNIGGDSYYDVRFAAGADIFANPAATLTFQMGALEDQLIVQVAGGRIYGNFYHTTTGPSTGGSAPYSPGANMVIVAAIQNEHITLFYNGVYILDQLVPHYQGSFTPNITLNNVPTSPPMVIYNLGIGTPRQYRPNISNATYYGSSGTNYLIGGGGDVHPSDAGIPVDATAVRALNFSAAASAPLPISLTLTGNYSVPLASSSRQSFDPNGANRIVTLPTIAASNTPVEFTIHNSATSGSFVLTINSALGGTIGTLANGATIRLGVKSDGTWMII